MGPIKFPNFTKNGNLTLYSSHDHHTLICGLRKIECVLILVGDRPTETKQSSLFFVYGAYFNAMVSADQFGWFDGIVFFCEQWFQDHLLSSMFVSVFSCYQQCPMGYFFLL